MDERPVRAVTQRSRARSSCAAELSEESVSDERTHATADLAELPCRNVPLVSQARADGLPELGDAEAFLGGGRDDLIGGEAELGA
jgi:hypothetical protein